MMIYEKLFNEYSQLTAQVLLTKESVTNEECRKNARQTFDALLNMHVVPIVNENDAISVDELAYGNFGDNDTLAANVAELVEADLLILLSDINGLYTDNPSTNPDAKFVPFVDMVDDELKDMGKESASGVGTGGMATKLIAAELATSAGADMVIANGRNMNVIHKIIDGQPYGTFFRSNEDEAFELKRFLKERFHE